MADLLGATLGMIMEGYVCTPLNTRASPNTVLECSWPCSGEFLGGALGMVVEGQGCIRLNPHTTPKELLECSWSFPWYS